MPASNLGKNLRTMLKLDSVLAQLRHERDRLNEAIAALETMHGAKPRLTAAGRARIIAAQRRRWAAFKAKKKR